MKGLKQLNYANLEATYNFYEKLRPLKLSSVANVEKYENLALMKQKLEPFNAAKYDIITKYADKDDKGKLKIKDGQYHISPENMKDFQNELSLLLNEEKDIIFIKTNWSEIKAAMKLQPEFELDWNDDIILFLKSNGIIDFEA